MLGRNNKDLFKFDFEVVLIIVLIIMAIILVCFLSNKFRGHEGFDAVAASVKKDTVGFMDTTSYTHYGAHNHTYHAVLIFWADWCPHSLKVAEANSSTDTWPKNSTGLYAKIKKSLTDTNVKTKFNIVNLSDHAVHGKNALFQITNDDILKYGQYDTAATGKGKYHYHDGASTARAKTNNDVATELGVTTLPAIRFVEVTNDTSSVLVYKPDGTTNVDGGTGYRAIKTLTRIQAVEEAITFDKLNGSSTQAAAAIENIVTFIKTGTIPS